MKWVLVTGGSRGIGAAIARLAVARGYAVAVNYRRRAEEAEKLVAELGGAAVALPADLSRESEVVRLFAQLDKLGPLCGLVNNAGILERQSDILGMDEGRLQRVFATNVFGPILCCREAVRRMSTQGGGAIVNISSIAARLGSPGEYVDYAASKGALDTFTIGLAREVASRGIRVNGVRPGVIHTEIHASGGEAGRAERLGPGAPLGRSGQPEEIAGAVLWLLSEEASYTTGAILDVSGGR
ncbi:MAG: SDR family oxidoreductase [Candidatus Eremiobacteraeota bacterium]|nr:SDR family oxidoreductase [Candidatus Eremiobacteraeota bacterium]MCW5871464.1 SDR family oxidoreductase [Candidatus Eremiobacteraeota bacterium]